MKDLTFENPQALWLLAGVIPVVALFALRSASLATARRRLLMGIVRCLWVGLCVVAAARPALRRTTTTIDHVRIVAMVDNSGSLAGDRSAVEAARQQLLAALGTGADVEELRFAGNAWRPGEKPADPSQTDIESALDFANRWDLDSPDCQVVLVTDARATRGDAPAAASRIAMRGGAVSVIPVGQRQPSPPRVTSVEPPTDARVGVPASVRVTVDSSEPARGIVRLRDPSGRVVDQRELPIDQRETLVLHFIAKESGYRNYTIEFESTTAAPPGAAAAPVPQVATSAATVLVEGPPRILLCDNFPDEAAALRHALEPLNVPIDVIDPSRWPDDLGSYAAIIISDFSGNELTPDQRGALRNRIKETGAGLVFIGGGNVVASRWRDNPLAEALPIVIHEPPAKVLAKAPEAAVCYVIDRSGSMREPLPTPGGVRTSKLALVKAAINASVVTLPETASVAVVAFDTRADDVVLPTSVATDSAKEDITNKVDGIKVGGGTAMAVGINRGLELLDGMTGDKYLVVLTDGDSLAPRGESWQDIADRAKARHISWTSIGVGTDINKDLLTSLADWAGGQHFFCETGDQIPKVFIEQAKAIRRVADIKKKPFRPKPGPNESLYRGPAIAEMPELNGMLNVTPRHDADVLLLGEHDGPLFASWQYGIGRVAAFTADAKGVWGAQWARWAGYSDFWRTTVQGVMRPPQTFVTRVRPHTSGNHATFIFEVRDKDGRPVTDLTGGAVMRPGAAPSITPAGQADPLPLVTWSRRGPGEYQANVDLPGAGTRALTLTLQGSKGPAVCYCATLTGVADAESAETGADLPAAQAIASAGGGIVSTDASQIASFCKTERPHVLSFPRPLWPWCVAAAILLWPFDLLLRKVL